MGEIEEVDVLNVSLPGLEEYFTPLNGVKLYEIQIIVDSTGQLFLNRKKPILPNSVGLHIYNH